MQITSRPFAGDADLHKMRQLITDDVADASRRSYMQVGDLLWGLYQNTVFDPREHIRLWEDGHGGLLGFAWFHPPSYVNWQLHPRRRHDGRLAEEMLAWGAAHRGARLEGGDTEQLLQSNAFEDDAWRAAVLTQHGFARGDGYLLHLHRRLDHPIPEPALPAGWTVRQVAGAGEFAERVAIHREVWHPSKVTLDAYRRLRAAPGYLPELDLAVVAPDGAFAAYCLCWLDPANACGEFEPVGTRAAYRGRGLGKALMLEGLRRLQARGAESAVVYSVGGNDAAVGLYLSAGFQPGARNYDWNKRLERVPDSRPGARPIAEHGARKQPE